MTKKQEDLLEALSALEKQLAVAGFYVFSHVLLMTGDDIKSYKGTSHTAAPLGATQGDMTYAFANAITQLSIDWLDACAGNVNIRRS